MRVVSAASRALGLLAAAAAAAAEIADPSALHPAFAPLARLLPPKPEDASTWSASHGLAFVGLVTATFEALSHVVPLVFGSVRGRIEARGRHLDVLTPKDALFLLFNRAASVPFTYHFLRALYTAPVVQWCVPVVCAPWRALVPTPPCAQGPRGRHGGQHRAGAAVAVCGVRSVLLPLPPLFAPAEARLPCAPLRGPPDRPAPRSVYKHVHKHHHRQLAPSRGNTDAINVHPFEFLVGEYLHLLAVLLTGAGLRAAGLGGVHVGACLAFIVAGGVAASLNHTRLDVRLPLGLFQVRSHDVHHRLPKANFGQYTQLWDVLLGTYRAYDQPTPGEKAKAG